MSELNKILELHTIAFRLLGERIDKLEQVVFAIDRHLQKIDNSIAVTVQ